ncbi:MAG: type II secretion system protein [Deltaproteobacteria bacterium]|nr:type II secretion system protein [Deltaproteobacteria bacterium]
MERTRKPPFPKSIRPRGFTLIELMLVIAIIMVGLSLAFWTTVRARSRAQVGEAGQMVMRNIELARSLSKGIPGDRIRQEPTCNTTAFLACGGTFAPFTAPTTTGLCMPWIVVGDFGAGGAANRVLLPQRIMWTGTRIDTRCEVINVANPHNDGAGIPARINLPGTAATQVRFAFMPNGRVVFDLNADGVIDTAPPANGLFIRVESMMTPTRVNLAESFGIRILPSGVVCRSNQPNPATAAGLCNMDQELG